MGEGFCRLVVRFKGPASGELVSVLAWGIVNEIGGAMLQQPAKPADPRRREERSRVVWQVAGKSATIPVREGGRTRTPMRATVFTLTLLVALAPVAARAADAAPPRAGAVIVFMKSAGALEEQVLRSLLVDSVTLELSDRRMDVIAGEGFPRSVADAVRQAAAAEADFVLVGTYALQERQVLLEIQWIDAGEGRLAAQASRRGPLDLSFDAVVADAVREILDGQAARIANLPPRQARPEAHPAAPLTASAMEQKIASLALPDVLPGEEALPASLKGAPDAPQPLPAVERAVLPAAQPVVPAPALRKVVFIAGTAPFISTFAAARYFEMGLSATLAGQYRIRTPGGFLGFGGVTGVHAFQGKGTYATANFLLVPVGPEVWYGTLTGAPFDFFARVNGGAAVFVAMPSSGNSLAKVVPYVSGGAGMTMSLGKAIAVSAEGSYSAYFDSPEPIMAYTPGVSILVRL
jgi:hypothetical protein